MEIERLIEARKRYTNMLSMYKSWVQETELRLLRINEEIEEHEKTNKNRRKI